MIRNRRNTLNLYRLSQAALGTLPTESLVRTFKGRIDKGTATTGFQNGKTTNITNPILFVDVDESFLSGDVVKDIDGKRYVVSKTNQPDGVSGISPLTFKAHKEVILEVSNDG